MAKAKHIGFQFVRPLNIVFPYYAIVICYVTVAYRTVKLDDKIKKPLDLQRRSGFEKKENAFGFLSDFVIG